jgi:hypothetical protein
MIHYVPLDPRLSGREHGGSGLRANKRTSERDVVWVINNNSQPVFVSVYISALCMIRGGDALMTRCR